MTAKLETHRQDLMDQLQSSPKEFMTSLEDSSLSRVRVDQKEARQCIDICTRADYRLKENIRRNNTSCVLGMP